MVRSIRDNLKVKLSVIIQVFQDSDLCKLVILEGAGGKAFCAGGDIKSVCESAKKSSSGHVGEPLHESFFKEEYAMNQLIATFKKPIVSLLNGITSP